MKNVLWCLLTAVIFCGCSSLQICQEEATPSVTVTRINSKITFDGKLDEKIWSEVPSYNLGFTDDAAAWPVVESNRIKQDKFEGTRVQFLYDDKYLYVGAELEDDDIISYATRDQDLLYRGADTLEIFLSPENAMHYWELYSTPSIYRTSFLFPAGGVIGLQEVFAKSMLMPGYETAFKVIGKINDHTVKDKGWTTELRIPLDQLAKQGVKFAPGEKWRILAARYNYSHYMYRRQLSAFPVLPVVNFHLRQYYAPVIFR